MTMTDRPVTLSDIPQIQAIHHWYILNSTSTFEVTPPPKAYYENIIRDLMKRNLPFRVMVSDLRKAPNGEGMIFAYAYLSPFRGHLLSYAPTVELSIWVHPEHRNYGFGDWLLCRLLYFAKEGIVHHCEEVVGDIQRDGPCGSRGVMKTSVIQNIIAVMAYDAMDPGNGDIYRKWFRKLGFYEKGQLWNVGRKMGRWIDTIYFQWSRPEPEDDE